VIDDIEDNSEYRRSKKAVHLISGVDTAINSATFAYFKATDFIHMLGDSLSDAQKVKIYEIFLMEIQNLHIGQGMDLWWHGIHDIGNWSYEKYLLCCTLKTGGLLKLGIRVLGVVNNWSDEIVLIFTKYVETLGIMFQVIDDVLNLEHNEVSENKGFVGEDIHEGKITWMIIDAVKKLAEGDKARLLEILKMKTDNKKLIQEAIGLINKSGSLDAAKAQAQKLDQACRKIA
jgi:octaprenyl-diphosphate synthase